MTDFFEGYDSGISGPATRHFAITPADADLAIVPRALWVDADGTLVIRDALGADITYNVIAGVILPFRGIQIRAASTATVVGWY